MSNALFCAVQGRPQCIAQLNDAGVFIFCQTGTDDTLIGPAGKEPVALRMEQLGPLIHQTDRMVVLHRLQAAGQIVQYWNTTGHIWSGRYTLPLEL